MVRFFPRLTPRAGSMANLAFCSSTYQTAPVLPQHRFKYLWVRFFRAFSVTGRSGRRTSLAASDRGSIAHDAGTLGAAIVGGFGCRHRLGGMARLLLGLTRSTTRSIVYATPRNLGAVSDSSQPGERVKGSPVLLWTVLLAPISVVGAPPPVVRPC